MCPPESATESLCADSKDQKAGPCRKPSVCTDWFKTVLSDTASSKICFSRSWLFLHDAFYSQSPMWLPHLNGSALTPQSPTSLPWPGQFPPPTGFSSHLHLCKPSSTATRLEKPSQAGPSENSSGFPSRSYGLCLCLPKSVFKSASYLLFYLTTSSRPLRCIVQRLKSSANLVFTTVL